MSRKHVAWAGAGLTLALIIGSPAVAEDVELLLANPGGSGGAAPNILFIFDTSGSMTTQESTPGPYDYNQSYDGDCEDDEYYWTENNTIPDCGGADGIRDRDFMCQTGINLMQTSGVYTDVYVQYIDDKWQNLDPDEDEAIECQADSGVHGDGGSAKYALRGTGGSMYTSNPDNEISWGSSPHEQIYTFYHGNYLNWFANPSASKMSRIAIVKAVTKNLMDSLANVNVGFMEFNFDQGGPVVRAVEDLDASRAAAHATVDALPASGYTPLSETMYEAALYWHGLPAQYGGSDTDPAALASGDPSDGNPPLVYKSPAVSSCAKNFNVLLTDGQPTRDTDAYDKVPVLPNYTAAMGSSSCTGGNVSGACLDDIAEYLSVEDVNPDAAGDQLVKTFTIGFKVDLPLLKDTAENSGGAYYLADDVASLTVVLNQIISEIFERDISFTAPTVSVNAFNRTRHLNDLYVTVLRATNEVHWPGNLKKYKLVDGVITDALGDPAVDPTTGFFKDTAKSYWTGGSMPDGPSVYFGGAVDMLPDPAVRNVYTNIGTSDLTAATNQISTANINAFTSAQFGLTGAIGQPTLSNLISWIRGVDVQDIDGDASTTVRRQMGDSLHSQPTTIVYGQDGNGNADVVIYTATNDGNLHATDAATGEELWTLIPKELLLDQVDLFLNSTVPFKHYGLDGDIIPVVLDRNHNGTIEVGTDNAYLVFGMRRGGNKVYALDVTSKNSPKMQWTKTFPQFGQTWSTPIVTKVNINGVTNPEQAVIIMGAGYDTVHDTPAFPVPPDGEGAGIFMLDLVSGAELWRAGPDGAADLILPKMTRSFPSEIRVLDMSGDGYANRMYAVDVGGQVWRFDIQNGQIASQLVQGGVIAQLGAEGQATVSPANSRRFYAAPDLALLNDGSHGRQYLSINVGSGYRAHPLDSSATDRFYSIRDGAVFNRLTQSQYDNYDIIQDADLVDVAGKFDVDIPIGSRGWKFTLPATEKILAGAAVFDDTVFFVTLEPNGGAAGADPCQPGGNTNRVYRVNIRNGDPVVDLSTLDPNDPVAVDAARVTELEQGGVAVRPIFLFPSPLDGDNCTGVDCAPKPVGCFGLECFDPDFENLPVRTLWSQNGVD